MELLPSYGSMDTFLKTLRKDYAYIEVESYYSRWKMQPSDDGEPSTCELVLLAETDKETYVRFQS